MPPEGDPPYEQLLMGEGVVSVLLWARRNR
jgi:hypothetical protein